MLISVTKRALPAVAALTFLLSLAASGATDKQLQRQRGSVSYKDTAGASHAVSGSIVLADDATALTGRASLALLSLPDSSEVSLGENTSVKVGAFNTAVSGPGSTISVEHGALKFNIRHPSGAKSNYTFSTPTSQIAVRGTKGFLIVGDKGTQVVCTECEPGDVTVTVAGVITALVTGQVFTVLGPAGAATTSVGSVSALNNPAVNQFANGANTFSSSAASSDVTGSASGTSGAAAAGATAGTGALAGGVLAAGAVAAAANSNNTQPQRAIIPTPPPPSSAPVVITPSSFMFSGPGQQQLFTSAVPVTVTSQNPSVATVMGFGTNFTIRAIAQGTTTLIVRIGNETRTIFVNVAAPRMPEVKHPL